MIDIPHSNEFSELKPLPNSFFTSNRTRFIENMWKYAPDIEKHSILIIKGGTKISKHDTDVDYYYFYQEANMYYLTGVIEPSVNAAIDIETGKMTLFYNEPPNDYKIWMNVFTKEEMSIKYNCDVFSHDKINNFIKEFQPRKILNIKGNNDYSGLPVDSFKFEFNGDFEELKSLIHDDILPYEIVKLTRMIKSEDEVRLMSYICDITMYSHKIIQKRIKPGLNERDIESLFMNTLNKNYYTRLWAYPCIGGSGCHSAILHYGKNDRTLEDGDLFLADMGIRFNNYTSDITCTFPVNGKFTKKQKEIYDIVLKSNRETMKLVKPGVTAKEIDDHSKIVILQELQKLGLIKSEFSIDELFKQKIQHIFMPHGLGHLVGIEVHDQGRLISFRSQFVFEKGMIFTIEPGIYFVEYALEKAFKDENLNKYLNEELIRTYFKFGGVRIEDEIVVTDNGFRLITDKLPRKTEEIEEWMSS